MTTRKIEIFTGNCPLCDDTVRMVQELAGNHCDVTVYNVQKEPSRLQQYAVKAVPAIAIDGILVLVGKPSRTQLEAFGIGQPNESLCASMYIGIGI
jgi:predicted DCC family thiol-disulfide oxidoreductase YuxK